MTTQIKIAAIQMNAQVAPTPQRLERATTQLQEAVAEGAQLVVLPEVFNTGYVYDDSNYTRAEPWNGQTVTWMREMAAEYKVHLAGTLLLLNDEDITNTMLLFAPDGRYWRYDKNYPWGFERAYFREGRGITVADTDLGKIGMLICWDAMHTDLWQRYAGKVSAMVVCSCPPKVNDATIILPDGMTLTSEEANAVTRHIRHTSTETFGDLLRQQAQHLRIPVVNTTGTGQLSTHVPLAAATLPLYIANEPDLWKHLLHAPQARLESNYFNETYIADADGAILAQVKSGEEGFVISEIEIFETPPRPQGRQPRYGISPLAYVIDNALNILLTPVYRYNIRRIYGRQMAPVSERTKMWMRLAGSFMGLTYFWGRFRR